MSERNKQNIIFTIFIIILITVTNESFTEIDIPSKKVKETADLILDAKSKLIPADKSTVTIPSKYYMITVKENGTVLSSMRWYMIAREGSDSYAEDMNGDFYIIKYKHVKKLLSKSFAYHFYEASSLPRLSVNGGDEISPTGASWSYRNVNGSMLKAPYGSSLKDICSYPVSGSAKLSFSIPPKKCEINLYNGENLLGNYASLEELPSLSCGLRVKIDAEWEAKDYGGKLRYEFYTKEWLAPVYTFQSTKINSGEFFLVRVENAISPHNIEFSSIPEIYYEPIFYGDIALIPIKKELSAPCSYTFTFKYGDDVQQLEVNVESRAIREDKTCDVLYYPSENDTKRISELFEAVTKHSASKSYFNEGFLDYAPSDNKSAQIAEVFYGFGHTVIPTNGRTPYRLDGVIYIFPEAAEIPSVCHGTVLHTGNDPILGLYAAVDHGSGLLTWYCNLSELCVGTGDTVYKGTSVGVSGNVGIDDINGVYLITTAGGIPVSPYPMQDG